MDANGQNGLDVTELTGASRRYYEAMQWEYEETSRMLDRLIAEKRTHESQATTGTTTTLKEDRAHG